MQESDITWEDGGSEDKCSGNNELIFAYTLRFHLFMELEFGTGDWGQGQTRVGAGRRARCRKSQDRNLIVCEATLLRQAWGDVPVLAGNRIEVLSSVHKRRLQVSVKNET